MRVLISGGGIAGPALAWWLAKIGAKVTILEKAPCLLPHGQSIDIEGTARRVVRMMGLMNEVRKHNTGEKGTQFIDPNGKPFAIFPVELAGGASPSSEFEILRGDLAKVFYEATKDHPNVTYVFGTTIKQILQNDDELVKIESSTGEISEYDLLVAADGQWSKTRKAVFPDETITVVDKGMYCTYWTVPKEPSDTNLWTVYSALGSRTLHLRPDPYGTTRAMFTKMPCTPAEQKAWQSAIRADRSTQESLLRSEFADAGWQAARLLSHLSTTDDFYFQALQQIKMKTWSHNRVVCLGDAAYAPTPLTGSGTPLAIMGAYVLAGELSQLGEHEHPARALRGYEDQFRPWVEKTQQIPWFVPGIAHPEGRVGRWLLQSALKATEWVLSVNWVKKKVGEANGTEEDYKLPVYDAFGDLGSGTREEEEREKEKEKEKVALN